MRLVLSSSNYLNTDLSDEQGNKVYTVSTPRGRKQITTIIKHVPDAGSSADRVVGTIEWNKTRATIIQIDGKAMAADKMLTQGEWNSWRRFTGPDGREYRWNFQDNHYLLQHAFSDAQLAIFHKRKFAFMMRSRPLYLDVAASADHMLDYVVITFLYVRSLPLNRQRPQKTIRNSTPRRTMEDMTTATINQMNQMTMMLQVTENIVQGLMNNQATTTPPQSPGSCAC